ncbi:hypothetical protein Trihar35433_10630 [Trichoderma harzianum]|nr:hypothetical protein Trihar35433_10630 [Trichoderma harzianum]
MCFGGQNERTNDPPPRPVQNLEGRPDVKTSRYSAPQNGLAGGAGGPSGYQSQGQPQYQQQQQQPSYQQPYQQQHEEFAPPPGPPSGKRQQEDYAPPAGPPPGRQQQQHGDYAPPLGPPPSHQHNDYAPPVGPPPSHQHNDYAPPPGPPPSHQQGDYAPPPGPPPSAAKGDWIAPPSDPYAAPSSTAHDWQTAVPDTSLFPPPPPLFSGHDASYANNATEAEAEAGEEWCQQYPLSTPSLTLDPSGKQALQSNNIRLMEPTGFSGTLKWLAPGHWEGSTAKKSPDRCIIGYPPLYVVNEHDPSITNQPKTIYYEVKIKKDSRTINLALGFTALPYPSFRLPGWHRGSLGVHGDDGHKYINDRWGGKDFTNEYRVGETYGIGMTFTPTGTHHPRVDIFFTRNGQRSGGWDLHEETDAEQDLPVTGLEGFHDLSCAIGAFDATSFEVVFDPAKWMYREAKFDL